ncbi:hypothetical protein DsansV1_C05g0055011 [Dioscorea sansibarensis]
MPGSQSGDDFSKLDGWVVCRWGRCKRRREGVDGGKLWPRSKVPTRRLLLIIFAVKTL